MPDETLGTLIKAARKKRDWSQVTLAGKLLIAPITVLRWEQDKSIPREEFRQQLIELLDLNVEIFLLAKKPGIEDQETIVSSQEYKQAIPETDSYINEQQQVDDESQQESIDFVEFEIPPMKIYRGWGDRDNTGGRKEVTVDGYPLPYVHFDRLGYVVADAAGHFNWGYTGGGPTNLALSILADYFGETPLPGEARREVFQAWKYHQNFKMDFVAWFDHKSWKISSWAIAAWLQEQQEAGDPAPEHSLLDVEHGWRGWSERWGKYDWESN